MTEIYYIGSYLQEFCLVSFEVAGIKNGYYYLANEIALYGGKTYTTTLPINAENIFLNKADALAEYEKILIAKRQDLQQRVFELINDIEHIRQSKGVGLLRKTLIELLNEAFSSGEITTLAFDKCYTAYNNFTAGMKKNQKIDLILDIVLAEHSQVEELLQYIAQHNPYQYNRYKGTIANQVKNYYH